MINEKISSEKIILATVVLTALGLLAYFIMPKKPSSVVIPTASPTVTPIITPTPEPTVTPTPTPTPVYEINKILNTKSVSLNKKTYKIIHYCTGTINQVETAGAIFSPISYCLGENKLVFIDPNGKLIQIKNEKISNANFAPILMNAQLLSSNIGLSTVLISYSAEPCSTAGDCGIGEPSNFITIAFDLSDNTYRIIKNFPSGGVANWNNSGTKAAFFPVTCGGGGCETASMIGYNLTTDETKNITSEKATWDAVMEIYGYDKTTSYWSDLTWIDDNQISATINYPNDNDRGSKNTPKRGIL